jgi:hypothetical protein
MVLGNFIRKLGKWETSAASEKERETTRQRTYTGMMIAIPEPEWQFISTLSLPVFIELLKQLVAQVNLKRFASSPRGPKKPQPQAPKTARTPSSPCLHGSPSR